MAAERMEPGAIDAAALLRQAAALLERRAYAQRHRVQVIQGPNRLDAVVEWGLIPGAVSVFSAHSGALLARAMPGQPLVCDPAARGVTARAFRLGAEPWGLTPDEQAAALQVAAERLAGSVRPRTILLPVQGASRGLWPHEATWAWPGVLRVADRFAGAVVAVSLPGQPGELAPREGWR